MDYNNIVIRNKQIKIKNIVGYKIYKKKENFIKIYYFQLKNCKNNLINRIIKSKKIKINDKNSENIKNIKNKIDKLTNENIKILFILNWNNNSQKIYEKFKKYFLWRNIKINYYLAENKYCIYNFIKNVDKDFLKKFDTIVLIGGDDLIHEIINGFTSRLDFDSNNYYNFVKIGILPDKINHNENNGLLENILKNSNLFYSFENSLYIILRNKEIYHSIQKYKILNETNDNYIKKNEKNYKTNIIIKDYGYNQKVKKIKKLKFTLNIANKIETILEDENEYDQTYQNSRKKSKIKDKKYNSFNIYGFLSFQYGNQLRINKSKLNILNYYKLLKKSNFKPTILINKKNKNLPNIFNFFNNQYNESNYIKYDEKIYSILLNNLPYLKKNYCCSPQISFNSNQINLSISFKKYGKIKFLKYFVTQSKAKYLEKDYNILNFFINCFLIKENNKILNFDIDGVRYYGKAIKCKSYINKLKFSG